MFSKGSASWDKVSSFASKAIANRFASHSTEVLIFEELTAKWLMEMSECSRACPSSWAHRIRLDSSE